MKRVLLMLAATVAFACSAAVAQSASPSTSGSTANDQGAAVAAGSQQGNTGSARTDHNNDNDATTFTGCLSNKRDSWGNYQLTNEQHKTGIEIGPCAKLAKFAGQRVRVSGTWAGPGGLGENGIADSTAPNSRNTRHLEVTHVTRASGTCSASGANDHDKNQDQH